VLLRVEGGKVDPPRAGGVATYMLDFTLRTCARFLLSYSFLPSGLEYVGSSNATLSRHELQEDTIPGCTLSVPSVPITDYPLIRLRGLYVQYLTIM
jgi:hypothetical protein